MDPWKILKNETFPDHNIRYTVFPTKDFCARGVL